MSMNWVWEELARRERSSAEHWRERATDLTYKLNWLVDNFVETEDGIFTFPDGETFGTQR